MLRTPSIPSPQHPDVIPLTLKKVGSPCTPFAQVGADMTFVAATREAAPVIKSFSPDMMCVPYLPSLGLVEERTRKVCMHGRLHEQIGACAPIGLALVLCTMCPTSHVHRCFADLVHSGVLGVPTHRCSHHQCDKQTTTGAYCVPSACILRLALYAASPGVPIQPSSMRARHGP